MSKDSIKLTGKQERFCEEYMVDMNATQAAIRAGYSEKTARATGCENLTKPVIQDRIRDLRIEQTKRTQLDADYVLNSIHETMERCKQAVPVLYKNGEKVITETPEGDLAAAYQFNSGGVLKGAELLGRHLGMFNDKLNLSAEGISFNLNFGDKNDQKNADS